MPIFQSSTNIDEETIVEKEYEEKVAEEDKEKEGLNRLEIQRMIEAKLEKARRKKKE